MLLLGFMVFKKVHITSFANCFEFLKSRIRLSFEFLRIVLDDSAMPGSMQSSAFAQVLNNNS